MVDHSTNIVTIVYHPCELTFFIYQRCYKVDSCTLGYIAKLLDIYLIVWTSFLTVGRTFVYHWDILWVDALTISSVKHLWHLPISPLVDVSVSWRKYFIVFRVWCLMWVWVIIKSKFKIIKIVCNQRAVSSWFVACLDEIH